jgi:LysM repeat protein
MAACAEEWLRIIEAETGRKPIIYSGPFFLRDRMCSPNGAPPAWGKNYILWIANYLDHEITERDLPLQPKGWADWTFWQYSETGLLDGIYNRERTRLTAVDLNFFRGTLEELYALAGLSMSDGMIPETPKIDVPQKVDEGEIVIPPVDEPAPVPTTTSGVIQHLIESGDTLFALAIKHRTTVDAILALNPQITNPNLIRVGDKLDIPQGG